jgi:hypothetical protein
MSEDIVDKLKKSKRQEREQLLDSLAEFNPEARLADGFEDAIMGYDTKGRAIYSVGSIIEILVERDKMSYEDASEHFSFNIECAYVGEYTPIYMYEK